jgi:hypothetical protein
MRFEFSRLRAGEVIVGLSALVLLIVLLTLDWYGLKTPLGWTAATLGVPTSFTGWDSLPHSHFLLLITVLVAFALVYFQGSRRSPAIPAALSVVLTVLAGLTLLVLIYRVLISLPGPGDLQRRAGAYIGLASAIALFYGAFASLRKEGIRPEDGPEEIELVTLDGAQRVEEKV